MNNDINPENKRYKPSKYNFFFEAEDGTHLAFNAISCGFAKINDSNYESVHNILQYSNIEYQETIIEKKLWENLIKGRFIVNSEEDELSILKVKKLTERFGSNLDLSLTISPTLSCNFKCTYCYEVAKEENMSDAVQMKLIKFIEGRSKHLRSLSITWMGGEPLLVFNSIEFLSKNFLEICTKSSIKYSAGIITNGYLLTPSVFRKLTREMSVNFFQITIDGPNDLHDKARPLKNGAGTFDTIISNLQAIKDILDTNRVKIAIRVNVNKGNFGRIEELIDVMVEKGLHNYLSIYPGLVIAITPACQDVANLCLSSFVFYKNIQLKFIKKAVRKDFTFDIYPKIAGSVCVADRSNAFVVGPDGSLYKCWNDVGIEEESIGFINDVGNAVLNEKVIKWLAYDPFETPKCKNCKFLPLCGGGCPYKKLKSIKDTCVSWRYNLEDMLKLYYYVQESKKKGGDKNGVP